MDTNSRHLFEILIDEHATMLRVYIRAAVRDWAAVEDLFQDTVLVAWQNLSRFDKGRPFGPWLRGIAGKAILAYYRRRAKSVFFCTDAMLDQLNKQLSAFEEQPGDTFDEKIAILQECLKSLPEILREVVDHRYTATLSRQQIAERLNITDHGVKKRLQRARGLLLDCVLKKLAAGGAEK